MTAWRSDLAGFLATARLPLLRAASSGAPARRGADGRVYGVAGRSRTRTGRVGRLGAGPAGVASQPWANASAASGRGGRRAAARPRAPPRGAGAASSPSTVRTRRRELAGRRRGSERGPVGRVAPQRADDGLAGAVPEQVGALGPDQRPGARTVLAGRQHQVGAAADDGERPAAELALGQLGQRRRSRRRRPAR